MKKSRKVFKAYIVGICTVLYVFSSIPIASGQLINSQFDGGSAVWNLPDDNNAQVGVTVDSSGNEIGFATATNQATIISSHGAKLDRIDTNITSSGIKLDRLETTNNAIQSATEASQSALEGTLIVSVTASALPSGAATEAKQDTLNTNISSSNDKLDDIRTAVEGSIPAGSNIIGKVNITDGTDDAFITSDGQLHVVLAGFVDTGNSTIDTLGNGGVFTGTSNLTLDYGIIFVTVFADQDSATDGLSVEQSPDGTNWDNKDVFTVPASTGKTYSFQPGALYFRVLYTNGATPQGVFRLQTICKKTNSKPSSHRIQDAIVSDDDAELVKAVITGKNPGGNFVNFQATTTGNLKIAVEEWESGLAVNNGEQLKVTEFNSVGSELWDSAAHAGFVKITDGTNSPDIVSVEGDTSLRVVPGLFDSFVIHLTASGIDSEQAFMLVDLSDTTNWPHTNTGHANVGGIIVSLDPATAFRGDVAIGFLTDVDGANGDMNVMIGWHFGQGAEFINQSIIVPFLHFEGETTNWFGPTKADNTNFQTDVNLDGPDGNTSYPSGNGDVVMLIERTAGTIDAGITVMYRTIE